MKIMAFSRIAVGLLALTLATASALQAPTGLLCDFKKSPSLGVRAVPRFGWIVPPCPGATDHSQTQYQVRAARHSTVHDTQPRRTLRTQMLRT